MKDNEQNAFLKINGVLTKFMQIGSEDKDKESLLEKYKSSSLKMTVKVRDGIRKGHNDSFKTGTVEITDRTRV